VRVVEHGTESALQVGPKLVSPRCGIIENIELALSLPDEPAIFNAVIERSHPEQLTDGHPLGPSEGGCSLEKNQAIKSAIGEAVERYCACIYRNEELKQAHVHELKETLDPSRIVNFSQEQINSGSVPNPYPLEKGEFRWVRSERLGDGSEVYIPAQLVYLNYDRSGEPFVRNPISTGLAAGMDKENAIARGTLEVIERDAFMIYYLTQTELPQIELTEASEPIRKLVDRLDRAGIDWYLLDARTDAGVPIVIAVLIDDREPTVSVAAAAQTTANETVRAALEEALQIRLYQRHLIADDRSAIDLGEINDSSIVRETRLLGWAHEEAADKVDFWTESDRSITISEIRCESDLPELKKVPSAVESTFDQYVSDVTTPDMSRLGFSVVRVVAPEAQPLYLREGTPYLDETRLRSITRQRGYDPNNHGRKIPNGYPHPFS
jgi:ribosomal protein S12 methylthiotransferase accessory factor